MKTTLLQVLRCPECGKTLKARAFAAETLPGGGSDIRDGVLLCACGASRPVVRWVPRMAGAAPPDAMAVFLHDYKEELKDCIGPKGFAALKKANPKGDKAQVKESFGYKWCHHPKWGMEGDTKKFMRGWILKKYGWNNAAGYRAAVRRRRWMLDAGAGLGREVEAFCEANPDGQAVGIELSDCVDEAYLHTRHLPNAHIVQGDLTKLPFRKGAFDFIFSEGALHHTPDTYTAFRSLLGALATGGEIAFYIYRKKSPVREFTDDYLRERLSRMTPRECWDACRGITELGRELTRRDAKITLRHGIPALGIPPGTHDVQRLIYWHFFKCFWNDGMDAEENKLVNFDWYHPALAHRHSPEEVRRWLTKHRLKIARFHVEEAGITVRARKP